MLNLGKYSILNVTIQLFVIENLSNDLIPKLALHKVLNDNSAFLLKCAVTYPGGEIFDRNAFINITHDQIAAVGLSIMNI